MFCAPIENLFFVLGQELFSMHVKGFVLTSLTYDMLNLDGVFIIAGPTGILISACLASSLAPLFRSAKLPDLAFVMAF